MNKIVVSKDNIPDLYEQTYTDNVENFLLVYNPISQKGISVLDKEAALLFNLIDGKRTLGDIFLLAKKANSDINFTNIARIFKNFVSSEIVYFGIPKSKIEIFSGKLKYLNVWFHITNQCTLRCVYCYIHKTPENMSKEMSQRAMKKIIESAKNHGFEKIIVKFSGGECLLEWPTILDSVHLGRKLAEEAKIKIEFIILTNGILITEKIADILKKETMKAVVSLDGLEKFNDIQRVFANGSGSFKYIEKGIKNLLMAKVPINISVAITSKNIEGIPELTRYLLGHSIPFSFNFYRKSPYSKEELEVNEKKLIEYLGKAYQIIYENPPSFSLVDTIAGPLDRVSFKRPHLYPCGIGNNYFVVRHDGKITHCQMTLENPIGSIDEDDPIEAIRKDNFVNPKNLSVEEKTPCNTCQWKYLCCGGCPIVTFARKSRYETNSPHCSVYKALIPIVLRAEAKRLIKFNFKESKETNNPS